MKDTLLKWLSEADVVFSVGKAVEAEIVPYINSLRIDEQPVHKVYIPGLPMEPFNVRQTSANKLQGTQNVTVMMGEKKTWK